MIVDIRKTKVQYINLYKDKEKSNKIVSLLEKYNFENVSRVPAISAKPKRIGVAKSFLKALKLNYHSEDPFLILEDDVNIYNENFIIDVPDDADAVYLGISFWGSQSSLNYFYNNEMLQRPCAEHVAGDVYRIFNMVTAHAVLIINPDYRDFLIRGIDFAISINTNQDRVRAETMKYWNIYAIDRPIFYQDDLKNPIQEKGTKIILSEKIVDRSIITERFRV